jgi:hypothetical protein
MGGFDWTLGVGRVVSMSLRGAKKVLVANIEGIDGESSTGQIVYGALGLIARALPADADGAVEPIYARTEDGLVPIAARDPRLSERTNPKDGEVMLVQYDGGFVSLKRNADGDGTDITLYAPKADGSAASVISIDTSDANNNITLMHQSGVSMQFADGKVVIYNQAGDAYVQVDDDGITINGNVKVNGAMVVGSPAGGLPVALAAPLTAWASAMNVWASAMNVWGAAVFAALPAAGAPPPAPAALAPVATTKLSASP